MSSKFSKYNRYYLKGDVYVNLIKKYGKVSKEVKASVAYTIGNILTKCLSLITLPIFARILTTEEYGLSTVYASTAAVVVIFTSLQLPHGSLNTAMIRFKDDRKGYLSSICAITATLTLLYILLCCIFKNIMEEWLDLPFFLIVLMGIEMLFQTCSVAWMGYQRFEYKYKSVVLVSVGTSVLSVALSLIAVLFSNNKGIARVCANSFAVCSVGLVIFVLLLKNGRNPFKREYWKYAISFNVPLIPYYLSQVVFNQSDRLMVDRICGRGDAAIYGVAYSLATVLTFIVSSIHSSYTPWIFERIDKKELQSNRRVTIMLSCGIAFLLLGIIALAPEIVYIMAGEKYVNAIWAVPPIAMSILLLYYAGLFDCLLFFYESKFFLAVAAIASAVINLILNYLFIPRFGFVAAAYTTMISYIILVVIDYLYMLKICKDQGIDRRIYDVKGLGTVFFVFSVLGFTSMFLYEFPWIRYSIIFVVIALMVVFRKVFMQLFRMIRKLEG